MDLKLLDDLTQNIELMIMEKKTLSDDYKAKIEKLKAEQTFHEQRLQKEIDSAEALRWAEMDGIDSIETENFQLKRFQYNPTKQNAYIVDVDEEDKDTLLNFFERCYPDLVKVEDKHIVKLVAKEMKQAIINQSFSLSGDGLVIDGNGEIMAGLYASLKPEEIRVKVKK